MDMEKGEGVDFAKRYGVNAFPTLLYFDTNGEMVYKSVGYKDGDRLIEVSKEALDPANRLDLLQQGYEASDKSLDNLLEYSRKLRQADQFGLAKTVVRDRLMQLRKDEKYSREVWQLLSAYVNDYDDPLFIAFVKQKKKYEPIADRQEIDAYVHHVLSSSSLIYRSREDDGRSLTAYIHELKKLKKYVCSPYYIARANYFVHMERADSLQFVYAQTFLDGDFQPDYDDGKMPYFLAFMANRYVDKDKERQAAALRWVRKSIDLDGDDYKNKFVLARLLYNAGELYEALEWAEQALAAEQTTSEAGVIKTLFKADTISAFIDAIKSEIYNQSD
jgi:hypothetical protein